jgi:hypothetical protein
MPHSTTIAETVTARFGSEDATGSAVGGIGKAAGGIRSTDGGSDAVQDSGPFRLVENPDAKDGQDASDTWTETTEPALIPKFFPVYAFI